LKEGITHLNHKMDAAMSQGSEEEMRKMYDLSKELYFSCSPTATEKNSACVKFAPH